MLLKVHEMNCKNCGSDSIIQNLDHYECQECGSCWFVEGYEPTEMDIVELKRCERENRNKRRFRERIRRHDVLMLASPSNRFFDSLDYTAGSPQFGYLNELAELVIRGANYQELKDLPIPAGCTRNYFDRFIRDFLSSRNELLFAPTLDDWCRYLHAPKEEIAGIFLLKNNHVDLDCYLESETFLYDVFDIVFSGRIQQVRNSFSEDYLDYLEENESLDFCLDNYYSGITDFNAIVEKQLSNEKMVIDRFRDATKTKRQEFFDGAIRRHLSIIDTVMLFVDYAFERYPEYSST